MALLVRYSNPSSTPPTLLLPNPFPPTLAKDDVGIVVVVVGQPQPTNRLTECRDCRAYVSGVWIRGSPPRMCVLVLFSSLPSVLFIIIVGVVPSSSVDDGYWCVVVVVADG